MKAPTDVATPAESPSSNKTFLSRKDLCSRWSVGVDFLRALEAAGSLHPIKLSARCLRYRLSEIEGLERPAE